MTYPLIALMLWPMLTDRTPTPLRVAASSAGDFPSLPGENMGGAVPGNPGAATRSGPSKFADIDIDPDAPKPPIPTEVLWAVGKAVPGMRTLEEPSIIGCGLISVYFFRGTDAEGHPVGVHLMDSTRKVDVTTQLDEAEIPPEILAIARRDWPADTAPFDAIRRISRQGSPTYYGFGHVDPRDWVDGINPVLAVNAETGHSTDLRKERREP